LEDSFVKQFRYGAMTVAVLLLASTIAQAAITVTSVADRRAAALQAAQARLDCVDRTKPVYSPLATPAPAPAVVVKVTVKVTTPPPAPLPAPVTIVKTPPPVTTAHKPDNGNGGPPTSAVPEPASLAIWGLLLGAGALVWRRHRTPR
jgi:hypothetical protein